MARKYRYHKPRHTFCYHLIRPAFKLVAGSNAKVTYGKLENPNRPYLIMFNHQTGHDQFYIYGLVPRTTYFVASEDLLAKGLLSRFLTCVRNRSHPQERNRRPHRQDVLQDSAGRLLSGTFARRQPHFLRQDDAQQSCHCKVYQIVEITVVVRAH